MEFERLDDLKEKKYDVLTARIIKAQLRRKPKNTLYVEFTNNLEAITSNKGRKEHFERAAKNWLNGRIHTWNSQKFDKVDVAAIFSPLEFPTGDVILIINFESGEKLILNYRRDIFPIGWLVPGGCSINKKEMFDPRAIATRELCEEVMIRDIYGSFYSICYSPESLVKNIHSWGMEVNPKEIIALESKEVFFKKGQAQNLIIETKDGKKEFKNVVVAIDPDNASVSVNFYREVDFPGKLEEIQIYDGERLKDGTLVKRAARLVDPKDKSAQAIFVDGKNIFLRENKDLLLRNIDVLKAGWSIPRVRELISIY